jgi:hypothetical protein
MSGPFRQLRGADRLIDGAIDDAGTRAYRVGAQERTHFAWGYHDFVCTRDENYVMFSRYYGTRAGLYDLGEVPEMKNDVAGERPFVVQRMFDDYILKDAGGPLPNYEV